MPRGESAIGMGSAPDREGRSTGYGGKVHISGIHSHHQVKMIEEGEFNTETITLSGERNYARVLLRPSIEDLRFMLTATEEEHLEFSTLIGKIGDACYQPLHHVDGIDLTGMSGKGCDADPPATLLSGRGNSGESIGGSFTTATEQGIELHLHGKTGIGKDVEISIRLRAERL